MIRLRPLHLAVIGSVLGLVGGFAIGQAFAQVPVPLASHRAVYDLKLEAGRGNGQIDAASGRIAFDFAGNACEGYTLKFRQFTELQSDGTMIVSDLRTTSWEDGAGKAFRFSTQAFTNNTPSDASDGAAEEQAGGGISVRLTKPEAGTFKVERPTIFPTEHLKRIVESARAGRSVLEADVYDGSETGRKVYHTLAVIGRPLAPTERPANDVAANVADLKAMTRWTTTISYFEPSEKAAAGEQTPIYSITFELYENGIARDLVLDYGEFVLRGTLSSLDIQPTAACR
jgi:EipB-like